MTSAVIKQGISFIKQKKNEGINIKIPRNSGQIDDNFPAGSEITKFSAEVLEDSGKLGIKNVEITTDKSGFSYFLDGIERKRIFSYMRSIPIIYGYVAGVVLKRTDKQLHSVNLEKTYENFYMPVKTDFGCPEFYFSEDELKGIAQSIKNIGKRQKADENYPMLPEDFIKAAHSSIQSKRNKIEGSLAKTWIDAGYDDGWLFVDGRLENKNKELISGSNIVGIIKSHHASYFNIEDQYKLYTMEKGQRSGVFQPIGGDGRKENVYSWYLKLHHDKKHGDNNFGLIRVEVPAEEEFLRKADLISSWILLEAKPVAFPASRWDRMIYPIKYCEDYLKSRAPSWTLINSLN